MMRLNLLGALALLVLPSLVEARAIIKSTNRGAGFDDATEVAPVGGNAGTTLGEQRRLALEHTFELWGAQLDSAVPIVVDVNFDAMGCTDRGMVLAAAGAVDVSTGIDAPHADPRLYYPSALANSLVGRDLEPDYPDIQVRINSSVDDGCRSLAGGFYYGFDRKPGDANDFVEVLLHELAHGLGFASFVDPETGALLALGIDVFSAQLHDLDANMSWANMTREQRRQSAQNVRRMVWRGANAARAVPALLARGQPSLTFDRTIARFSGFVSDTDFGLNPALAPASGAVVLARNCTPSLPVSPGKPWVGLFPACSATRAARAALEAGAVGALLVGNSQYEAPPMPLEAADASRAVSLPVLMLSESDARDIQVALSEGELQATLGGDANRYLGASADARPLMFASQPVSAGSSVSHLEPSMRPNQLMEPVSTPAPSHDLTLARAMLMDLGWSARCGDGQLDPGEECDRGQDNSETLPDGCRRDCRYGHCGDGVRDKAEACDLGTENSDTRANACRTRCVQASCGDGVRDTGEQCDLDPKNSDVEPDVCRANCRTPRCGDGVVDALEQCDDGRENDDMRANACRSDCRRARCGDGVVDAGEACDRSPGCSRQCELPPPHDAGQPAVVVDAHEKQDAGDSEDAGAPVHEETEPAATSAPPARSGSGGCDCRAAPNPQSDLSALGASCVALLWWVRKRRRGSSQRVQRE